MKIKGLLMGMAAFMGFALVSCSDDVIDVNNQEQPVDNTPAYLTVAFNVNSSSSRGTADDANNKGDIHGTAEDSQHYNAGSEMENAITKALIVVKGVNKSDVFAKLYTAPVNGFDLSKEENHKNCYILAKDIEMTTGEYEVLVVANPYESLYAETQATTDAGDRDLKNVTALYNKIIDGKYEAGNAQAMGGSGDNFAGEILNTSENKFTGIMMVNKKMGDKDNKPFKLTAASTTIADIEIERVASKITFRNTYKTDTDGNTQLAANVYPVNVPDINSAVIKSYTATTSSETPTTKTIYQLASLNGTKYWVVTKTDGTTEDKLYTFYAYTSDDQTTFDNAIESMTNIEKPNGLQWVYDADKYKNKKWYVKLEEFALVNLSKQVYNVRHTITDGSVASFGTLNGENYIYTPNWESSFNGGINNVSFTNGEFEIDFTTSPWFFNTLANVSEDSKNRNVDDDKSYFRPLPTGTDPEYGIVPGTDHSDRNPNIGNLLAYCLENTTDTEHQIHGLSTGITFMGKIYDENMQPITTLYRYNSHLFESIADIKKAYGITEWADLNDQSSSEDCAAVGITKYESNICYYYTTEIKHYDNGLPGYKGEEIKLGNMEFAVVRNNIYSLSVANVNIIGDPWVDPTPSTEDEVEKPKLEVHATILPWIVRYHDIEFN